MLDPVTVHGWRIVTRLLRAVAFIPWTLALIQLARHGELDGQLWWGIFLAVYGLVLIAELGRSSAERPGVRSTATSGDAG